MKWPSINTKMLPFVCAAVLFFCLSDGQFGKILLHVLELSQDARAYGVLHVHSGLSMQVVGGLLGLATLLDQVTNVPK